MKEQDTGHDDLQPMREQDTLHDDQQPMREQDTLHDDLQPMREQDTWQREGHLQTTCLHFDIRTYRTGRLHEDEDIFL